jgi:hypothetical protein
MDVLFPAAGKSVRSAMLPWLALALLLVFEFRHFRQFAEREVVWCYPTGFDQASYLSRSYRTFERIVTHGVIDGVTHGLWDEKNEKPNGALIEVEASVLYLLLGPSRLSALTLNFAHFALLQVVLAATLRWYSGRWSPAFLGVGLLLTTASPFYFAGGIMDFRIDFIAFCLVGIFVCVVIRSAVFQSWRWSIAVGVVAGYLVLFRFLTAVYLAGILGLFFLLVCCQWAFCSDLAVRERLTARLRGLLVACTVLGAAVTPAIVTRWRAIHRYYVEVGVKAEGAIRYQEVGVSGLASRVLFYPRSVLLDHVGQRFLLLSGLCVMGAFVAGRLRRGQGFYRPTAEESDTRQKRTALTFASACVLVPLGILTLVSSPSPVVASAVVVPLLWVILGCVVWLLGPLVPTRAAARYGAIGLATVAVVVGVVYQACELGKQSWMSGRRAECEQVLQMYDEIGRQSRSLGWTEPRVTMNTLSEHLFPLVIGPTVYERQGLLLSPRSTLSLSVTAIATDEEANWAVRNSEFVVLALTDGGGSDLYPYIRRMRELRPKMLALCESMLVHVRTFHLFGQEVALFVRPSVRVEGATADRWISDQGLDLFGDGIQLRSHSRVELRGRIDPAQNPCAHAAARAELMVPGQASRSLQASVWTSGPEYRITIDVPPEDLADAECAQIHLTFDRCFVPSEHPEIFGANHDCRRLVWPAPDEVTLLARP